MLLLYDISNELQKKKNSGLGLLLHPIFAKIYEKKKILSYIIRKKKKKNNNELITK